MTIPLSITMLLIVMIFIAILTTVVLAYRWRVRDYDKAMQETVELVKQYRSTSLAMAAELARVSATSAESETLRKLGKIVEACRGRPVPFWMSDISTGEIFMQVSLHGIPEITAHGQSMGQCINDALKQLREHEFDV